MVRIRALTRSNISHPDQQRRIGTAHPKLVAVKRKVRISPFWRHFLNVFAVKWAGMVAAAPVVLLATHGLSSTSQALRLYPRPSVLSDGSQHGRAHGRLDAGPVPQVAERGRDGRRAASPCP